MDRRSAFISVRGNSQGRFSEEQGSEYECEISYPPPPPQPHPAQPLLPPPPTIPPAYWYWYNAYAQLLEHHQPQQLQL
jgi:hypothetical protein